MLLKRIAYLSSYFVKAKYLNKKQPILGGIKLTHRCTLKCRQCPYWQRPQPDLAWAQIVKILPLLKEQGVRILILEGGEPLLWKDANHDIQDVINLAKEYFWSVGVTTNGTLPLDITSDIVWVSIDGLQKTHDLLRGKSFEKIITNIKQSKHPNIYANITLNKLNYLEIPELVKFISPLVKGITVQFFFPYQESEELLLTWREREKALNDLIDLKNQGYPISDSILALEVLKNNSWKCEPWMLSNVDPSGNINYGCYLKNRTEDENPCLVCGFAAHTEISLAYQFKLPAIFAGRRILKLF